MGNEPNVNSKCPGCGEGFRCGIDDPGNCWCAQRPKVVHVPSGATGGCLCPTCLDRLVRERQPGAGVKASAAANDYRPAGGPDGK